MADKEYFASGHRGCAGCGMASAVRTILNAAGPNTIVANATGCLEVMTTGYPESAWEVPWIHAAFENAAAVASGVEAGLKARGRREGVNLFAFAGDGGTFDIGIQALSGMLERGHKICYVCYDNEAYMNTGIQRSASTPFGASTTTSPAGSVIPGKTQRKKPIAAIVAAHDIPYTATANIAYPLDLEKKVKKALSVDGPSFIQVMCPCVPGWGIPSEKSMEIARLAIETGVFILWDLEGADFKNIKITKLPPKPRKPVLDYLKVQSRFKHLVDKPDLIEKIQKEVDEKCKMYGID
ncbi:MAG: pyruvate synthase subunit beta [Euryarchaeota archaeon]|nr:pyruvate synthase subunit beta [Euryarchaeota archaeon]